MIGRSIWLVLGIGVALLLTAPPVHALVNLELRPLSQTVAVGSTVSLGLYAVDDGAPLQPATISAMDVVILWDPAFLNPISFTNAGNDYAWFQSGFLYPGGLNASLSDGDAVWTALAQFLNPALATPAGILVTTFQFQALALTPGTTVAIAASVPPGGPGYETVVYWGGAPNTPNTGSLGSAVVTIVPEPTAIAGLGLGCLLLTMRTRRKARAF